MNLFKIIKLHFFSFLVFLSFILYFLSLILVKNDSYFSNRWFNFSIWITSILLLPLFLLVNKNIKFKILLKNKIDLFLLVIIILLAIFLSFSFLTKYPFVSIYDQVRDGGLNAMEIANGSLNNIFGYGRYASHGLMIPTITSFFYLIFKNSVLTFRFPGAFIAVLDVIVLYIVVRKSINRKTAFWSSLVLLILPLHLYYSRTEIVVIFSSFFMSFILLLLSFFIKNKRFKHYALFGLLLGFSSGFHTSIRTVAIITMILVFAITFYEIIIKKIKKKILFALILMVVFYLIGFGPRILFTTPDIFFQARSFLAHNNSSEEQISIIKKIEKIGINYEKSLLVYFVQPTISTHYADFKPILNPILGILFIIGFIYSLFFSKNIFLKYVCFFALIIPLTNSAITEVVNSDNRLAPIFPISAIFVGIGIHLVILKMHSMLKIKERNLFLIPSIFVLYLLFLGVSFFTNEPASKQYGNQDYLSMHTVYFLKSNQEYKNLSSLCFFTSPANYEYFKLMHVQEQYQYFTPNKYIRIIPYDKIPENQIFISKTCNTILVPNNYKYYNYCSNNEKFTCPGDVKIVISKEVKQNKTNDVFDNNLFPNSLLITPIPSFIP